MKNKKAPARRKAEDDSLLTTKLFCGYCGALMFGESGTSRTGEVHRYYKCATAKKRKGCKKKTVRKQWLEDLVVNQTMQLVKDDAAMESINGWIKAELFMDLHVTGEKPVKEEVDDYILFFNEQRPAYSLGYLTPKQYRERHTPIC